MDEPRGSVTLAEAQQIVDEAVPRAATAVQTVPVRAAAGRVLLGDQDSRLDLPPFDKSAMDGYAIRAGDERRQYRLLETVAAGQTPRATLEPGTTVKVMTGAPVPPGTGKVVMREFTDEAGDCVHIHRHDGRNNICARGEDVRVGDVIAAAGRTLDAVDVANLVACGVTEVPVAAAVRVAVVSTGDEIVDDPAALAPGKIMNANGPLLAGLARACGLDVVGERSVGDDLPATAAALGESLAAADVVVLSGGVSVGDFDYVPAAFEQVGLHVHFSSVAIKPGRPTVFATRPPQPARQTEATEAAARPAGRIVFGLPGNPVSACLMFHLFVLRAAARLSGAKAAPRQPRLPLARGYRRRNADRMGFVPGRLTDDATIEPLEYHGSAHLLALSRADGFFAVPLNICELAAGEVVSFVPLRGGRQ